MAYPAKTRTYNNTHIYTYGLVTNENIRQLMFLIKEALISGVGAWTVVSSSGNNNGAGFTFGAADYWIVKEDVIWASSGNRSWIVLQQNGTPSQLMIECYNLSVFNARIKMSPGGIFTGGSTTVAPTATDEWSLLNNAPWGPNNSTQNTMAADVLKSSDGKSTRVIISSTNTYRKVWLIEEAKNVKSWWTNPVMGFITTTWTYSSLSNSPSVFTVVQGVTVNPQYSGEFADGRILTNHDSMQRPNYIGEWLLLPIGLIGQYGKMGEIADMWWAPYSLPYGITFDSQAFLKMGDVVINWPGGLYVIG